METNATPQQLGIAIRYLRKQMGIRQHEIAAQIHVARTSYLAMEQGMRKIKDHELFLIACVLNLEVQDIKDLATQVHPEALSLIEEGFEFRKIGAYERQILDHFENKEVAELLRLIADMVEG